MRAIFRAMPKTKDNKCYICGRIVPVNHQSVHLFNYDTKACKLHIYHTHPHCAKEAGMLPRGREDMFTDRQVWDFWRERMRREAERGNYGFCVDD